MLSPTVSPLLLGTIFFLGQLSSRVSGLDVAYCADFNTASTNKNSSIYQSNGACSDFCIANYAFAVLQDDGCWCSNYAPAATTTGCDTSCPGFPSDLCGGSGLWGYIALVARPQGTVGPEGPSTTTRKTTADAQTTPSTTRTTDTDATTTDDSTKQTWTPTPVISLQTVTGRVETVTLMPTAPPSSQAAGDGVTKSSGGSGLGTGGAVGLTIGLVAVVAIAMTVIYFCIKKRRQAKAAEELNNTSRRGSSAGLGGPVPSRTMSENSRYVLGTDGRQVVETWEPDSRDAPGSRRSRLMPVDPRLDPFAPVYQRGENKSRESVNTIQDNHDYSRRVHQQGTILRATNPDE